jgi:hypothetical protein
MVRLKDAAEAAATSATYDFNSKMVRLKEEGQTLGLGRIFISIPKWCD